MSDLKIHCGRPVQSAALPDPISPKLTTKHRGSKPTYLYRAQPHVSSFGLALCNLMEAKNLGLEGNN